MPSALGEDQNMRSRVLAAATALFAERGYPGTSLQAVADAVGIRKTSVLYHFSSKEELREGVLESLLARWKDVVPRVLKAATSGENRFDDAIHEVLHFFRQDPARARLLLRECLDRPAEMKVRMDEHLGPWIRLVADYIQRGQETGQVRKEVDPEAFISWIVLSSLSSMATAQVGASFLSDAGEDPSERQIRELLRAARLGLFTTVH